MKIPRILKIGGKKIKVRIRKSDYPAEGENVGEWDGNRHTIMLDDLVDAPIERMEECFLHEIIESINELYELNLTHWKITVMSEVLFQIIKDNKLDFR